VANVQLVTELSRGDAAAVVDEIVPLGLLDPAGPDEPGAYRYHRSSRVPRKPPAPGKRERPGRRVAPTPRRLARRPGWRTAAYHYEAIEATDDLQRVLVESAPAIMARGEFDIAHNYVDRLLGRTHPVMNIFASRVELDQGDTEAALEHARAAYEETPEDSR